MSEAKIIGCLSTLIANIDACIKIYGEARKDLNLPEIFETVNCQHLTISSTLQAYKNQLDTCTTPLPDDVAKTLEDILDRCKEKALDLRTISQEITTTAKNNEWEVRYRNLLQQLGQGNRVEELTLAIAEDVQQLVKQSRQLDEILINTQSLGPSISNDNDLFTAARQYNSASNRSKLDSAASTTNNGRPVSALKGSSAFVSDNSPGPNTLPSHLARATSPTLSDITDDKTQEVFAEKAASSSSISKVDWTSVTSVPPRRVADEVFRFPKGSFDPELSTFGLETVSGVTPTGILNPDFPNDIKSQQRFILGARNPQGSIHNVGQINTNRGANVMFGTEASNAVDLPKLQQNFGQINLNRDSTLYFSTINKLDSQALFRGLKTFALDSAGNPATNYRRGRTLNQSISRNGPMPTAYLPHVTVSLPELTTALIKIAVVCQFLDAGFAEYFRIAISPVQGVHARLHKLREQICSRQSSNAQYVGSFGEYCEQITGCISPMRYQARVTGDEIQPYLQDALEVPYWDMMADQFIKSDHVNDRFIYDTVLSVINDKRRELRLRLEQARLKWRDELPAIITDGINRRIVVLDALLAQTSDKYDSIEELQLQKLQRSPTSELRSAISLKDFASSPLSARSGTSNADNLTDLEKVSLLSLFFFFTASAMIPFGMAFSGDWNAEPSQAVGATSDPEFKWRIATTLLTVYGNIYAVVPLWKITRGSVASVISQAFLYLSIILGVFSVCVYPFWNKAWSSSLSFLCTFFALGSVFISTQHTSKTAVEDNGNSPKIKKE